MRYSVRNLVLGLAGLFLIEPAGASTLFSVNFDGTTPLYTLDQATGAATIVGGTLLDIGDLTSDQVSTIWGVSLTSSNNLVQIDPMTGNAVNVVPITGTTTGAITSLAFDPLSQALYGNTSVGFGDAADRLFSINTATGVATLIGAIGFDNVYALGFDQSGNLFGVSSNSGELIGIDTVTGAGSAIALLDIFSVYDIASRPEDNAMFAVDSGTGSLYRLNTATGVETLVGPWNGPGNLVGLAFTSSAIPEPGTIGLFLWGLAGLGIAARRRPPRPAGRALRA